VYHADEKSSSDSGTNGISDGNAKGNFYDPDLAHPAADYNEEHVTVLSSTSERKLVTKIDLRVIPVLSILYLLAFLDRTNIANASIYGLVKDLNLKGIQYNTALTIFFVPYIVFEIPSNILLKRLKPHVWLSVCMFMFVSYFLSSNHVLVLPGGVLA
jgi:hypothetical protein